MSSCKWDLETTTSATITSLRLCQWKRYRISYLLRQSRRRHHRPIEFVSTRTSGRRITYAEAAASITTL